MSLELCPTPLMTGGPVLGPAKRNRVLGHYWRPLNPLILFLALYSKHIARFIGRYVRSIVRPSFWTRLFADRILATAWVRSFVVFFTASVVVGTHSDFGWCDFQMRFTGMYSECCVGSRL